MYRGMVDGQLEKKWTDEFSLPAFTTYPDHHGRRTAEPADPPPPTSEMMHEIASRQRGRPEVLIDGLRTTEVEKFLKALHHGTAHASVGDMAKLLKKAAASDELLRRCRMFKCATCSSLGHPSNRPRGSATYIQNFNQQVLIDFADVRLEPRAGVDEQERHLSCRFCLMLAQH